jgi:hypothetical protein
MIHTLRAQPKGRVGESDDTPSRLRQKRYANNYQSKLQRLNSALGNRAMGRLLRAGVIQPKLRVGQPNDKYEREADQVAEQVMRMPEEQVFAISTGPAKLQRKCAACASGHGYCSKCVEEEEEIQAMRGGGQPLPSSVRAFFGPRFGVDFSGVRIHQGAEAASLAKAIDARAYTVGRDVAFDNGQYSPYTTEGKKLLAHELTHVLQQGGKRTSIQRLVRDTMVKDCNKDSAEASSDPVNELRQAEQKAFELLVTALEKINSAENQYQEAVSEYFVPKLDELEKFSDAYWVARHLRKAFGLNPNKMRTWENLRTIRRRLMKALQEISSVVYEYVCCKQGTCCEQDPLLCDIADLNCKPSDRSAYTTDQDRNRIVLCSKFWKTPKERGLTIIHEVLHLAFIGLITDKPSPAFHNAHNYEKFVKLLNN